MLEFIKEYGVTDDAYEYIVNNVQQEILENLILSEVSVKDTLKYYNKIGITSSIANLIVYRPDLIMIETEELKELLKTIDIKIFINLINNSIEDLVLFGI